MKKLSFPSYSQTRGRKEKKRGSFVSISSRWGRKAGEKKEGIVFLLGRGKGEGAQSASRLRTLRVKGKREKLKGEKGGLGQF